MPSYNVLNKKTGEVEVREMKIAEMEQMLKDDPNLDVVPGPTPYGDPWRLGVTKPDSKFTDLIKDIKRRNPGNTIDSSFGA